MIVLQYTMTCPMIQVLQIIGKRWTLCILHIASQKPLKFNEVSRELRINPRTLSERLGELVTYGILQKTNDSYTLTKKGTELIASFTGLDEWAKKYDL